MEETTEKTWLGSLFDAVGEIIDDCIDGVAWAIDDLDKQLTKGE